MCQARPDGSDSEGTKGPARLLPEIEQAMAAFGDISITVDVGPIIQSDLIAARWTMRARYTGGLDHATAPLGTAIAFSGHDILRVSGASSSSTGPAPTCWPVSPSSAPSLGPITRPGRDSRHMVECYGAMNYPMRVGVRPAVAARVAAGPQAVA
ncbi:hypothetical protein [Streptomyces sp. NPDC006140]|uniref:hypothetical protein n=1 Tax=Streptomyces sp. NPDC006140 TaxID=3154579 RepID=UPI0033EDF6E7